jgi:hypothetical protein
MEKQIIYEIDEALEMFDKPWPTPFTESATIAKQKLIEAKMWLQRSVDGVKKIESEVKQ